MMTYFSLVLTMLRDAFMGRSALQLEILVLRQQLVVLKRTTPRPQLRFWDRLFWVMLSRL